MFFSVHVLRISGYVYIFPVECTKSVRDYEWVIRLFLSDKTYKTKCTIHVNHRLVKMFASKDHIMLDWSEQFQIQQVIRKSKPWCKMGGMWLYLKKGIRELYFDANLALTIQFYFDVIKGVKCLFFTITYWNIKLNMLRF